MKTQALWAFSAFVYGNSSLGDEGGSRNSNGPQFCISVSSPPSFRHSGSTRRDTVRAPQSLGLSAGTLGCAPYSGPSAADTKSLGRRAPSSPSVPRQRRREDKVSGAQCGSSGGAQTGCR